MVMSSIGSTVSTVNVRSSVYVLPAASSASRERVFSPSKARMMISKKPFVTVTDSPWIFRVAVGSMVPMTVTSGLGRTAPLVGDITWIHGGVVS